MPGDPALSLARARVPPGVTTRRHCLDGITERYLILAGSGRVEVEGLPPTTVQPGDVVLIPPGVAQRIANPGPDELLFLAACTPRFRPECYRDLEPALAPDGSRLYFTAAAARAPLERPRRRRATC